MVIARSKNGGEHGRASSMSRSRIVADNLDATERSLPILKSHCAAGGGQAVSSHIRLEGDPLLDLGIPWVHLQLDLIRRERHWRDKQSDACRESRHRASRTINSWNNNSHHRASTMTAKIDGVNQIARD